MISGPQYATRRGLRVGDPSSRITELYGPPVKHEEHLYRYRRGAGRDMTGMAVVTPRDTVTRIGLGVVFDLGLSGSPAIQAEPALPK
jgi:hypothetical protein